jgi:Zn-dependent M28 family amino/carboxypeptidase
MGRSQAIVVMAVILAWAPAFEAASAATVQTIVDSVSTSSYESYQLFIEGMGPDAGMAYRNRDWVVGSGGTAGNLATQAYLTNAFAGMGLSTSTQGTYQNIVGELLGTTTPDNIYIIGAHLDHIAGDSPGGDDNASGTAGILEAARVLSQYEFESTIRFIGFNAEEDGLWGSLDYVVNQVVANSENVVGMVNMDMILRPGWENDPSAVIDIDLGTSANANSQAWAGAFQQAAEDYVPSLLVDETVFTLGARSDHYPFDAFDYAAFTAIENTDTELAAANPYYHTSNDASDRAAGALYDYDFASDVVRASVGLIAQEAMLIPEPSTLVMLATAGLAAFPLLRRRRRPRK